MENAEAVEWEKKTEGVIEVSKLKLVTFDLKESCGGWAAGVFRGPGVPPVVIAHSTVSSHEAIRKLRRAINETIHDLKEMNRLIGIMK